MSRHSNFIRVTGFQVYDVICFLAQQCVEKYLKAWLQEVDILFSKTHDLETLLDLIVPAVPAWQTFGMLTFRRFLNMLVDSSLSGQVRHCHRDTTRNENLQRGSPSNSIRTETFSKPTRRVGVAHGIPQDEQ